MLNGCWIGQLSAVILIESGLLKVFCCFSITHQIAQQTKPRWIIRTTLAKCESEQRWVVQKANLNRLGATQAIEL